MDFVSGRLHWEWKSFQCVFMFFFYFWGWGLQAWSNTRGIQKACDPKFGNNSSTVAEDYLEDHPRYRKWLIATASKYPK